MDQPLAAFIDHARSKGMDHATIRMLLLSAGWKEKEIARALTAQALDMPVPTPPDVGGAREAFLHLLVFAALYATVIAGVSLVFDFINLWLPDAAMTRYVAPQTDALRVSIRWEMSTVIVAFPLLLWLSRVVVREMRAAPDKAKSPVRRWLTYLTLFFTSIALAVDVTVLVSALLEGELSARFVLKILVVLVAAGATFAYYLVSLQMAPERMRTTRMHGRAAQAAAVVVLTAVVAGFFAVGAPAAERRRQFDARRIDDIRMIYEEVLNISIGPDWRISREAPRLRQALPTSLEAVVARAIRSRPRVQDPATGAPYEYAVLGESRFRVCGTFDEARRKPDDMAWDHPAGRHCFDFDAASPLR